jgi:arginyl-tRNA synthetase
MLAKKLQVEVAKVVKKHWQIESDQVTIDIPKEDWQGDFTSNIALKVSARWGVPSAQVADILVGELVQNKWLRRYFSKVATAGPGFVNFFISADNVYKQAKELTSKTKFNDFRSKKIVIEYSSPIL